MARSSPEPAENPCGGVQGFIIIMMGMFTLFLIINRELAESVIKGIDPGLRGLVGFGGTFPIWTLFFAGLIMIIFSTISRHYFTDWVKMAETQKKMGAYQKELRKATLDGNKLRVKKLQEQQPMVMKMQNQTMINSLKPMVFTMFLAILIWRWLFFFLPTIPYHSITLPWSVNWDISRNFNFCPTLPYWIVLYSMFSIPIGQLLMRVLKVKEFGAEIKKVEDVQAQRILEDIKDVENSIEALQDIGAKPGTVQETVERAKAALDDDNFLKAKSLADEAKDATDRLGGTYQRTKTTVNEADTMIKRARKKGVGVDRAATSLKKAKASLKKGDYTSAIFYAKEAKRRVADAKEQHQEAESVLRTVKATIYDMKEIPTDDLDRSIEKATKAMERAEYEKVLQMAKETKKKGDEIKKTFEGARAELDKTESDISSAGSLGIDLTKAKEQRNKAKTAFQKKKYKEAADLAISSQEEVAKLRKEHQDASESLSFAKLIVANAQNFGAEVTAAEALLAKADSAVAERNYGKANELATQAKEMAEEAKRQITRDKRRKNY